MGELTYNSQNELDKACLNHMVYGAFKDLKGKISTDELLGDKAFEFIKYIRYD